MNIKPYQLTFDVTKKEKIKLLLKQFDSNTRLLEINITQFGEPLTLARTVDAYFYAVKPDGYKIFDIANIVDYENGKILITLTNQALMVIGSLKCELVLKDIKKNQHLSSFPFTIVVAESYYSDDSHRSMHQDGAFEALSKKVDDAIFGEVDMSNYYNVDEVDGLIKGITVDTLEYTTSDDENIKTLRDALDKLLYSPLAISSFSLSKTVAERGEVVEGLKLTWDYNKTTILEQQLNGTVIDKNIRQYVEPVAVTNNTTFRLIGSDGRGSAERSATINFYNGRYHGTSNSTNYNNDFVKGLVRTLSDSRVQTFNVNCLAGQHIFYCIPVRLGVPVFTVNGFQGGFSKVETLSFTNASGFTESYDIWKTTNSGLGNTTVSVS